MESGERFQLLIPRHLAKVTPLFPSAWQVAPLFPSTRFSVTPPFPSTQGLTTCLGGRSRRYFPPPESGSAAISLHLKGVCRHFLPVTPPFPSTVGAAAAWRPVWEVAPLFPSTFAGVCPVDFGEVAPLFPSTLEPGLIPVFNVRVDDLLHELVRRIKRPGGADNRPATADFLACATH